MQPSLGPILSKLIALDPGSFAKIYGKDFPIRLDETDIYEQQLKVAEYTFGAPLFVYIGGGIVAIIQTVGLFFAFGAKNVQIEIIGLRVRLPLPYPPPLLVKSPFSSFIRVCMHRKVMMHLNCAVVPFLAFVIYLCLRGFNAVFNTLGFILLPCITQFFDAHRTAMVSEIWPVKKKSVTALQRVIAVTIRLGPVVLTSVFTVGLAMTLLDSEFAALGHVVMVISG